MRSAADRPAGARLTAVRVLVEVLGNGRSLSEALPKHLVDCRAQERPLATEISYGVLRWLPALKAELNRLVKRPLKRRDRDIEMLALVGLYQLGYMRVPAHAAVSETVACAVALNKHWARGLLNATLRRSSREHHQPGPEAAEEVRFAHPDWLIAAVRESWPHEWMQILDANNQRAPMTVRVNSRRHARAEYLALLAEAHVDSRACRHAATGVVLERPVDVAKLPGFDSGSVSVQDEASQLAAPLLRLESGQRVLDACAAPGGKAGHILEHTREPVELVAVERSPERCRRLEQNLTRLGLEAQTVCADVTDTSRWWDGRSFERILLDAPCSATGVIRRHPDIKWLRQSTDAQTLGEAQRSMMAALWPLLAPGGLLLYATCSILRRENQQQVERFIHSRADALECHIDAAWGQATCHGRQVLPGSDDMDGFFYAVLAKR